MRISVLDYGYIEVIEAWGSDERIIEAARMSTDKGFLGWLPEVEYKCSNCGYVMMDNEPINKHIRCPTSMCDRELIYKLVHHGDEKLLSYLWRNKHTTPFEMGGMTIEVQAPIFVFREWHRHRTQSYNEFSARYSELPDLFYIPSSERLNTAGDKNNKQATGRAGWKPEYTERVQDIIEAQYRFARDAYVSLLNYGVPREIARVIIPVGQYSKMRASANLWNWLRFLKLRLDEHAQFEIRQYAIAVQEILSNSFPRTMELFVKELENGR